MYYLSLKLTFGITAAFSGTILQFVRIFNEFEVAGMFSLNFTTLLDLT